MEVEIMRERRERKAEKAEGGKIHERKQGCQKPSGLPNKEKRFRLVTVAIHEI